MKTNLLQLDSLKALFQRQYIIYLLKVIFISVLVVIGTFPDNDYTYSIGIDPPLAWVFNHLYATGFDLGENIIFPHGPLAFFMYPLPDNILVAAIVMSVLKVLITLNLVNLLHHAGQRKWLAAFAMAYLLSLISGFNHLLLANVILLYANYFRSGHFVYKLVAFALTAFAFYIKSYIAVISLIITFSFLAYFFFTKRNFKSLFFDSLIILTFMILLWVGMYGNLGGFINYCVGMYHLAQDNSSSASLYPYNNWWYLGLFLLIILLLPFVNRSRASYFYGILIMLSIFGAWKHGVAREDSSHVIGFWVFSIVILGIYLLFERKNVYRNLACAFMAVMLLTLNMKYAKDYVAPKYELLRANNFFELVTDYEDVKARSQQVSMERIAINKMPQAIRDSIGSATADAYPWDYSIIAANNLNWQPRPVIQSYAAYTSWLDGKNAAHFASEKAPEYFIWDADRQDLNGSNMTSIDFRYLLNDEPKTMIEVFRHYKPFYSDKKFLILKKREKAVDTLSRSWGDIKTSWNRWISVPIHVEDIGRTEDLMRAKLKFSKSFLQSLKSFLYKDEHFWVYMKLSNGEVHKYRIVPKNAEDGLWLNPYIYRTNNVKVAPIVTEIMFKCSNNSIMNEELSVEWDRISFANDPGYIRHFFGKSTLEIEGYRQFANDFEQDSIKFWTRLSGLQISTSTYYNGKQGHILPPNTFSATFSYPMDSLPKEDLRVTAACWAKTGSYRTYSEMISLVITVEDASGILTWKGIHIDYQLLDGEEWDHIFNLAEISNNKPGCTLKVFVWNTSDTQIFLDDVQVKIAKGGRF